MPTVTKLHNGAYQVSDIINGYREVMTFYAYSKREAIANSILERQWHKRKIHNNTRKGLQTPWKTQTTT